MSLEQEYEQRRVILDAVAIEVRKLIAKVDEVELDVAQQDVTIPAAGVEWRVAIRYSRKSGFVSVDGHPHRHRDEAPTLADLFGMGRDQLEFSYNCPADWVPRDPLS